jgi:hypothetical protein
MHTCLLCSSSDRDKLRDVIHLRVTALSQQASARERGEAKSNCSNSLEKWAWWKNAKSCIDINWKYFCINWFMLGNIQTKIHKNFMIIIRF